MRTNDDGVAVSSVGNVAIIVWRLIPSAARMRLVAQATLQMLSSRPDGHCYLVIIERSSTPPKAPERAELSRVFDRTAHATRGYAFVIEGDDARTWIVRAILRGIAMLVRSAPARKVFVSTVSDGITWLGAQMDLGTNRTAIEREVAELRALMPAARHEPERPQLVV